MANTTGGRIGAGYRRHLGRVPGGRVPLVVKIAPRRHQFRPIDFLVPVVVAVVLLCLALFWAPRAGTDWTPFRGSVGGERHIEVGVATPTVLGEE